MMAPPKFGSWVEQHQRRGDWRELVDELGGTPAGFAKIVEWARAYVDNETCIGDVPEHRVSVSEREGVAMLGELEARGVGE